MTTRKAPAATSTLWRRSSYSYSGNNCLEVAQLGGTFAVRDSKNPDRGQLSLSTDAWLAFVADIKRATQDPRPGGC